MKRRLLFAFTVSVLLHAAALWTFFRARTSGAPAVRAVPLSLYPELVRVENLAAPGSTQGRAAGTDGADTVTDPASPAAVSAPPAAGWSGRGPADPASDGGTGAGSGTPSPVPKILLRSPFARTEPGPGRRRADSLAAGRVSEWVRAHDFSKVEAFPDAVAQQLRRRSSGTAVFSPSFGAAAQAPKEERRPAAFDFIPTETHVRTLESVYRRGKGTQTDLYLDLGTSVPVTAALYNKELEFLVEKGFLARRKISPENPFTIATPFGGLPIEMSGKNRRNPVYEYRAAVDRGTLAAYLQSHEFRLRERLARSAAADTAGVAAQLRRCERNLLLLAR